ncbi:hypothetical protein QAD02_011314 [Eretmocerus hayati]|uniref:Uncharacterized protein n=1 Tax=Eretmocerus hayati TaxID=131215 RepID=A0ACC2NXE3_9HYME|nr:hypothetical protein QAD02_011314 [Eretmocerus hayati]
MFADLFLIADSNDDRSIFTSTNFTNYKSIFTLVIRDVVKSEWKRCLDTTIAVLVGLAKFTKILGKTYDFKDMTKLIDDDKAILVGALLLKLNITISTGCPLVRLVDPNRSDINHDESDFRGTLNHSFPLATLHTSEGCIPNVDSYRTHGNQFVICALRPIEAGEQVCICDVI